MKFTKRNLLGETVLNRRPRRGDWLVDRQRKRVYGRVVRTRRSGHVVVQHTWTTEHFGGDLYEQNCEYDRTMPTGDGWQYFVNLSFSPKPWQEATP